MEKLLGVGVDRRFDQFDVADLNRCALRLFDL